MTRELRIDGIILAAGKSSRFGRAKQLLPFAGKPLLQHMIDAASASSLTGIVVVTGANADLVRAAVSLPKGVRFVHNPDFESGQASSLAAGLLALSADADAAAVVLADQPAVTAEIIDRIASAFLDSDADAARPLYGRVPGHPVILARDLWPELLALTGDTGARAVLSNHPERLLEVPFEGAPPPDIDTEDDYKRLLEEYEDQ